MSTILYTRKGDAGQTSLYDGTKLDKGNQVFEILGKIDECIALIGELKLTINEYSLVLSSVSSDLNQDIRYFHDLQIYLMDISTEIAMPSKKSQDKTELVVKPLDIETRINLYNRQCPKLTKFLIPGTCKLEILAHYCRVKIREIERLLVTYVNSNSKLAIKHEVGTDNYIIYNFIAIIALCTLMFYSPSVITLFNIIFLSLILNLRFIENKHNRKSETSITNEEYFKKMYAYIAVFNRLSSLFFAYARMTNIYKGIPEVTR